MTLRIDVDDRTLTFDESRPLRVGRAADCDVVLEAMSVSRLHAELRPGPDGWRLVDAGGQLGTFVGGQRISDLGLQGTTTVQLGPPTPGSSIVVTVEPQVATGEPAPVAAAPFQADGAPAPAPASGVTPAQQPGADSPDPGSVPMPWPAPGAGAPAPAPTPLPASSAAPSPAPVVDEPAPAGFETTHILAGPLFGGPGGFVQPRTGPDLMIEAEGHEHRFRHPDHVTIGRLPESSIVISDPVASRAHLRVDAVPGGWGLTNLSREGTWHDGRRVESMTFDDELVLRLGHPTAGPEITLLPVLSAQEEQARLARKRRGKRLKVGGAVVGALVLVAVLVVGSILIFGGSDDSANTLTAQELDVAKAKTVLISYAVTTETGEHGFVSGSGSIIGANGLILTNAHVADPNNPGLTAIYGTSSPDETFDDPEYLTVSLTNPDDGFATDGKVYRAHLVASDGNADAAVIQIYADSDGNEVDPDSLNLPYYEFADDNALQTGQDVTVLGFPGIARSGDIADPTQEQPEVSVSTGDIATIINTERLGPRSEIDTTARISPGNSGGSAIDDDGRLLGVPSSTFADSSQPITSGRIRPLGVLTDVIAKGRSEAK